MSEDGNTLEAFKGRDIIDVRSEAEFALDHVPGAINLPVLNNEERAHIGTLYTRVSRFHARREGAALVAMNIGHHIDTALSEKSRNYAPIVYCWRGGMRSGAMAHVLRQVGWQALAYEGGYRRYRRALVKKLYDQPLGFKLIVLSGHTGCAKTELLARVRELGLQTLDLEALAQHRGSIFGADQVHEQPSQKMFESRLMEVLGTFDPARPILIECESGKIGKIRLPPSLWSEMSRSPEIEVTAGPQARAEYLCRTYNDITKNQERLIEAIERLTRVQGHVQVEKWKKFVEDQAFVGLATELILHQYDPSYARSMARRKVETLATIELGPMLNAQLAQAAMEIALVADSRSLALNLV